MYPYCYRNPAYISQDQVEVRLNGQEMEASSTLLPVVVGDQFSVYVESTSEGSLGWELLDSNGRSLSYSSAVYRDSPLDTGPYTVSENGALQLRIWCRNGQMLPCSGYGYISKTTMPMEWEPATRFQQY